MIPILNTNRLQSIPQAVFADDEGKLNENLIERGAKCLRERVDTPETREYNLSIKVEGGFL